MRNRFSQWPIYLINLILVRYALKRREMTAYLDPRGGRHNGQLSLTYVVFILLMKYSEFLFMELLSQLFFNWVDSLQHPTLHKQLIIQLVETFIRSTFNRNFIFLFFWTFLSDIVNLFGAAFGKRRWQIANKSDMIDRCFAVDLLVLKLEKYRIFRSDSAHSVNDRTVTFSNYVRPFPGINNLNVFT